MDNESRMETYRQLIMMGYEPAEAWEEISRMEFTNDYEG